MRLSPHGRREVLLITLLAWIATALIGWFAALASAWIGLAAILPVGLWGFTLAFFRDPQRTAPAGPGLLVSPADGRIADITRLGPESDLGQDGVRVGIFMNLHNVHVNRMPCDATVLSVEHLDGVFLDARDPASAERNESARVVLQHAAGGADHRLVVRQVAGLVARRIVTAVEPGDTLARGERFGMIKFGSRLELLLPDALGAEVRVEIGQVVYAGVSVLAQRPGESA